ncbi:MAG: hypothetical protein PHF83_03875 [Candidatus Methanomethylophilus sp.]|nr:hypothetical protein [Methanomethylophilus sp.]
MNTCKIIDTCTLINLFSELPVDLSLCFSGYDVITTDAVITEYTCKVPRKIPSCISVAGLDEKERKRLADFEYLFPNLGVGERSVYAKALSLAAEGCRTVILSDDKIAVRKMSAFSVDPKLHDFFPGAENIIWGDSVDALEKLRSKKRLSDERFLISKKKIRPL